MTGRAIEPRNSEDSVEPTSSKRAEGHGVTTTVDAVATLPRGRRSSARHHLSSAREPGELDGAHLSTEGQPREGEEPKPRSQTVEQSDESVVPEKPTKTWVTPVETVEGRDEAEGKPEQGNVRWTQRQEEDANAIARVGQRAREGRKEKWNNLLSHLRVPLLRWAYHSLRANAAAGVDAVTWSSYGGEGVDGRLADLEERIHSGGYHPQPVRRVYIPKTDGKLRPLGIPALEDKIVQQAVRALLEPIYEAEFLGFSYGFRPGRSPHDALDALHCALKRETNWVLDADIRAFFDTVNHGWMQKFLEHRIGDRRLVRLVMRWLKAGVLEEGRREETTAGTPQGGIISPLLANIYLHYVFDLWVQQWRNREARGEVYVVRYADDFVMGFQYEREARTARNLLEARLQRFGLQLHPEKTRVVRFGKYADKNTMREAGREPPEPIDFLGFTHIGVRESKTGRFTIVRRTSRKKRKAKYRVLAEEMRRRRHQPMQQQHRWLASVLRGIYKYYAVPGNLPNLARFRHQLKTAWYRGLQRRSQRGRWNRADYARFERQCPLPWPRLTHRLPIDRYPKTRGGSPVREIRSPGPVRGAAR